MSYKKNAPKNYNNNNRNHAYNSSNTNTNSNNTFNPHQSPARNNSLNKRGGTFIRISGHPQRWNFKQFQNFLNQAYSVKWLSNKFVPGANEVTIEIESSKASNFVRAVNNRQVENGVLRVSIDRGGNNSSQNSQIEQELTLSLQQRYNVESKFMSLANLKSSIPSFDFGNKSHTDALCRVISSYPDIVTLELAHNNLQTLSWAYKLMSSLSELSNLSLANNNIANVEELNSLSPIKDHLLRLIISDNYAFQQFDPSLLQYDLTQRFPSLQEVDSKPVFPLAQFGLPSRLSSAATMPQPQGSCIDPSIQPIVEDFITTFFRAFDMERRSLQSYYTDVSYLSISTCKDVDQNCNMEPFQSLSRNLIRTSTTKPEVLNALKRGPLDIMSVLAKLPETFHDIEAFTVDAFPINIASPVPQVILNVSIFGQFLDTKAQAIREFYRTLVLAPAPAGSEAAAKGLKVVITNDSLYIVTKNERYDMSKGVPSHPPLGQDMNAQHQQPQQPQQLVINGTQLSVADSAVVYSVMHEGGVDANTALQALQQTQGNAQSAIMGIRQARGI